MRTPLLSGRRTRQRISNVVSYPAPVGGWNARDALAEMAPTDAVVLNNWFPRTSFVEFRGGFSSFATGMTQNGKTLMPYNKLNGTNQLFCATAAGIYNVGSGGAVGASVLARTNGKHQWTMFGDGTSNWLIACNGVDKPAYYDGTTWTAVDGATTPALTGVTTTTLIGVTPFKGRLLFVATNTLGFWYLTAGVAGGALSYFDLAGVAQKGGYLMAIVTWTVDAGNGPDDRAVFITSEGEVLVYVGTNPASATAWSLVGVFTVGKPLGRRCVAQYGGDAIILTQNGTFPLSAALQSNVIDYHYALSFKIENAFTEAARSYQGVFGWRTILYPAFEALIVNVPFAEDGTHEQYVMNTITKSWCKFTGWNAEDFAVFNGELYFTAGTVVYKAWTGTSDNGANIDFYGKQAFHYFGRKGQLKHFTLFRPILAVNGNVQYLTDIDVDFEDDDITGSATFTVTSGAKWDVDLWDVGVWGSGLEIVKQWTSPQEWEGYCAAGKVKISTNALMGQWMANDMVFELGGVL